MAFIRWCFRAGLLSWVLALAPGRVVAAEVAVRTAPCEKTLVLLAANAQPDDFRYLAFPSILRFSDDEVWLACKAGRAHATDAGAAMEIVRHTLSTGVTTPLQRLSAPRPKLYQMGEFVR